MKRIFLTINILCHQLMHHQLINNIILLVQSKIDNYLKNSVTEKAVAKATVILIVG